MLLYEQGRSVSVEQEDINFKITVHFKDYFHEMESTVTINTDTLEILAAEAQIINVPWDICHEVGAKMNGLVGLKIEKGIKEKVRRLLGGSKGCVHMVDLAMDTITAVVRLRDYHVLPKEMPYEERMERIREINIGICHTYGSTDRNPKLLRENVQSQLK